MSAYIIVEIDVHNPSEYEAYKKLASATIQQYNGKYVVRGGKTEVFEGEWNPKRIVVLEFPDANRAKEWFNSPEYAPAKLIRQRTATARMICVEGI